MTWNKYQGKDSLQATVGRVDGLEANAANVSQVSLKLMPSKAPLMLIHAFIDENPSNLQIDILSDFLSCIPNILSHYSNSPRTSNVCIIQLDLVAVVIVVHSILMRFFTRSLSSGDEVVCKVHGTCSQPTKKSKNFSR